MQQVMGNSLPFGGIPVLFVGDFNQLGPVKKTFIPSSMMMWATRRYHTDIAVKTSTLQNTAGPLSSSKTPFLGQLQTKHPIQINHQQELRRLVSLRRSVPSLETRAIMRKNSETECRSEAAFTWFSRVHRLQFTC